MQKLIYSVALLSLDKPLRFTCSSSFEVEQPHRHNFFLHTFCYNHSLKTFTRIYIMHLNQHKAFTMLELTFVIVIIGILSAVAIPKFAATRDDATITKAITTVAAVRNAVSSERQKRILRGNFKKIKKLTKSTTVGADIFDGFDGNTINTVLEYPLLSCKSTTAKGCWKETKTGAGTTSSPTEYTYKMPVSGSVIFQLINNKFDCKDKTKANCKLLTR